MLFKLYFLPVQTNKQTNKENNNKMFYDSVWVYIKYYQTLHDMLTMICWHHFYLYHIYVWYLWYWMMFDITCIWCLCDMIFIFSPDFINVMIMIFAYRICFLCFVRWTVDINMFFLWKRPPPDERTGAMDRTIVYTYFCHMNMANVGVSNPGSLV